MSIRCMRQCVFILGKTHSLLTTIPRLLISSAGMANKADLQRVKSRAEETDKILADLQVQIETIRKVAVRQAGRGEEEKLLKENEDLKREVESLKKALAVAEIANGVRQVALPTKGSVSALMVQAQAALAAPEKQASTQAQGDGKPNKTNQGGGQKNKADQEKAGAQPKKAKTGNEGKEPKQDKGGKAGKEGGEGKSKKSSAGGGDGVAAAPVDISRLDLRVGKIVGVEKHPDADGLYVEQVELGEDRPRTVVSGLVKHVPINAMKERVAVFMCNLKPAKMRGILSEGMIMCAVTPEKTEILVPPTDSVIGDRVLAEEYPGTPDAMLNPKKKVWETLKPDVRTNGQRLATYKGAPLVIPGKGPVMAPTLADAQIS